jgi:cbb3-type cytochrome oxidase maturation protein
MEVLIFLIPIALILGGLFIGGCLWAIQSGQYDDLETPAQRLLIDDLDTISNDQNIQKKGASKR